MKFFSGILNILLVFFTISCKTSSDYGSNSSNPTGLKKSSSNSLVPLRDLNPKIGDIDELRTNRATFEILDKVRENLETITIQIDDKYLFLVKEPTYKILGKKKRYQEQSKLIAKVGELLDNVAFDFGERPTNLRDRFYDSIYNSIPKTKFLDEILDTLRDDFSKKLKDRNSNFNAIKTAIAVRRSISGQKPPKNTTHHMKTDFPQNVASMDTTSYRIIYLALFFLKTYDWMRPEDVLDWVQVLEVYLSAYGIKFSLSNIKRISTQEIDSIVKTIVETVPEIEYSKPLIVFLSEKNFNIFGHELKILEK